ncbi:hypothetical protein OBBRIDRAFT_834411 [Obba rivulosa]|uniref:Uncharacterized protein n=1 Tax=Obba rivulosa TaxID=1052685 RepID=A0A8E2DML1_9APHY|nr:hypothetical protein OBBRIDRAFT_834411 [Obba rivulosa]
MHKRSRILAIPLALLSSSPIKLPLARRVNSTGVANIVRLGQARAQALRRGEGPSLLMALMDIAIEDAIKSVPALFSSLTALQVAVDHSDQVKYSKE